MYGLASKNDHTASIAVLEQHTHHLRRLSKGLPITHKKPKKSNGRVLHDDTIRIVDTEFLQFLLRDLLLILA